MIIDGEKYACEACVRGHRVSNCQHSDRPLQHINKKGRPVSQCQHCRAMRKSRSAHVKCDCGEKTSKCSHLQPSVEGHKGTCCCNHGGRCTCATKLDGPQLDTVPESDPEPEKGSSRPKTTSRRRRANTSHSDGLLSFDENGHHKPAHKNKVSQKCGPYQVSRGNSAQGSSNLPSPSSDGLSGEAKSSAGASGRSAGGVRGQRRVKSEATSPHMSGSSGFQQLNGQLPPLDLSNIEYPAYMANSTFELFGSSGFSDPDGPIFSAGLTATSVDWSHYDLADKADNFGPSSYSQSGNPGFNSLFEFGGSGGEPAPALAATTSTSGEVSEVEDNFTAGDVEYDSYLRSGHYIANGADIGSIDYDSFLKSSANKFLPTPASLDDGGPMAGGSLSLVEDDPAFWVQNYNDGIVTLADSPDGLPSATGYWDGQ